MVKDLMIGIHFSDIISIRKPGKLMLWTTHVIYIRTKYDLKVILEYSNFNSSILEDFHLRNLKIVLTYSTKCGKLMKRLWLKRMRMSENNNVLQQLDRKLDKI